MTNEQYIRFVALLRLALFQIPKNATPWSYELLITAGLKRLILLAGEHDCKKHKKLIKHLGHDPQW